MSYKDASASWHVCQSQSPVSQSQVQVCQLADRCNLPTGRQMHRQIVFIDPAYSSPTPTEIFIKFNNYKSNNCLE
jgi:hypothetical protein